MSTSGGSSGGGTISDITSMDSSVTITDPMGPTTDLSVAGGGGGTPVYQGAASLTVNGSVITDETLNAEYATIYDPVGLTGGIQFSLTTTPVAFAMGTVVANTGPTFSVSGVDTTNDALDLHGSYIVSDLAGTNIAKFAADVASVPQVGPGQSGSLDFSAGTGTILAGTDLSFDMSNNLTSTAGGIYVVTMSASSGWD